MAGAHLRDGDLTRLVAVIEDARHDDAGAVVPWTLLHGLHLLIPCDGWISFQHHAPHARRTLVAQWVDAEGEQGAGRPPPDPDAEHYWSMWWRSLGSWPMRTGDLRSVVHTGDFLPSERARRADPMLCAFPELSPYLMILSLPAPPGEVRRINFEREGHPFTERDRQLAAILRPHVHEIWQEAERRRRGVPRLTPREWEVLELAAAGTSYADIAARLFLSVSTVRKHMENVRERLGVHSAAAAAALALPRPPGPGASTRATEAEMNLAQVDAPLPPTRIRRIRVHGGTTSSSRVL
jgi:DNA-binding CsgD family transcriptional regulator